MLVTFDGENKLILPENTTGILNVKYVYSEWKRWIKLSDNLKYFLAFATVGGDPITTENDIPTYFYLMEGWRIKWPDGHVSVEIQGNLLVYGGQDTPYKIVKDNYSHNVTSVVATHNQLTVNDFQKFLDAYTNKDLYKADTTLTSEEIANKVTENLNDPEGILQSIKIILENDIIELINSKETNNQDKLDLIQQLLISATEKISKKAVVIT